MQACAAQHATEPCHVYIGGDDGDAYGYRDDFAQRCTWHGLDDGPGRLDFMQASNMRDAGEPLRQVTCTR